MNSLRHWLVAFAALAVVTSQPDSPSSPDADTEFPTSLPTLIPTHLPTLTPTYYPTFTRRPTLVPSVTSSPSVTFDPTPPPTHSPTSKPTPYPTASHAPTATGAPTYPTPPPTHLPTTWEPTTVPTLSPTTELTMFGQQFAIGVSFIMVIVAYAVYSLNKPSELASRGLDYKMFRIREFKIEKRWACKFCGFVRNRASGPDCRQCGTNQLGEQEILPVHTSRGVITDRWTIRTPLVSNSHTKHEKENVFSMSNNISIAKTNHSEKSNLKNNMKNNRNAHSHHNSTLPHCSSSFITSGRSINTSVGKSEGQRLIIWERPNWPFSKGGSSGGVSGDVHDFVGDFSRLSELPVALALSELGFLVTEKGLSGATINTHQMDEDDDEGGGGGRKKKSLWGKIKKLSTPKMSSAIKKDGSGTLEWVVAQGGVAESEISINLKDIAAGMGMKHDIAEDGTSTGNSSGKGGGERYFDNHTSSKHAGHHESHLQTSVNLYDDALSMRKCFYPEKVAWFYEQVGKLRDLAISEHIPIEYATTYPSSVLRDSYALLNKVTPQQVLASAYKVQLIAGHSHSRSVEVDGEVEEKWLQALFSQFVDPSCDVLIPSDSGALELSSPISLDAKTDVGRLSMFSALGRAIAMALVRRVFVGFRISPNICKLLVGEPISFFDLLHSDQALFQDLLRLMMMPDDAVKALHLMMPDTTTEGGTLGTSKVEDDSTSTSTSSRNGSRDGVHWPGRGSSIGTAIDHNNRLEYVFRKTEYQIFGRTQQEFTALRQSLYEVIPASLLQVFDYREFSMLLNGYHKADSEESFTVSV